MANEQIVKVYDLTIKGSDKILKDLDLINKSYAAVKTSFQDLKRQMAKTEDATQLAALRKQLESLKVEEKDLLNQQRQKQIHLKELQILRQQELKQQREAAAERKKEKEGNQALAGTYNELAKKYRDLLNISKNTTVLSNPKEVAEATAELKRLKVALDDFNRGLSPDGTLVGEYTTGIVNAFKRMGLDHLIHDQVNKAKKDLDSLNSTFNKLEQELSEVRVTGEGSLEVIHRQMIENRNEAQRLETQIHEVTLALKGTGGVGDTITASLRSNFKNLKQDLASFVVGYLGLQQGINLIQSEVRNAKELADATTDLEIQLGNSVNKSEELISNLAKFDTRDKLVDLERIADISLKAGTTAENIEGVAKAVDIVKVAFGKDFGDVETGTETFVKLINIFFADGEITGDRILKIGNAIRTIANETVASVPYINDFTGRMAGLKQISNVTLPDIIGLGAGFEEFKQSAEVSSTVLVKVIPKLAQDTEKFAAIAGLTKQAFTDLLNNNPVEALIRVAEALVKNGKGIEEVSEALGDAELGAGRVTTILATLGGKADTFRENITRAKVAILDTAAIEDAFAKKNENLAGTMDKVNKKFADAANSKGFQFALLLITSLITGLFGNLPIIITLLGLYAAGWALSNQQMIIQRGLLVLINAQLAIYRVGLAITTVLQTAYTVGLGLLTGAYNLATGSVILFNNAIRVTPLGIILTILGVAAAGFVAFGAAVTGSTSAIKAMSFELKFQQEIQQKVKESTAATISNIQTLTKVAKDNNASLDTRKRALNDLISLSPEYLSTLTLENLKTAEGTKLVNEYIKSLRAKAAFEAAQSIRDEKLKKDIQLSTLEFNLQKRVASGSGVDLQDLTEEERALVGDARKQFPFFSSLTDKVTGDSAAGEALAVVKAQRAKISAELETMDQVIKDKYVDIGNTIATGPTTAAGTPPATRTPDIIRKEIKDIKTELDKLDTHSDKAESLKTKLKALKLELKKATGTDGSGGADSLDAILQNKIKDIDAKRDENLAKEETRFIELGRKRKLDVLDEINHYSAIQKINEDAINKKLKLITGANSEERKVIAQLKNDKIKAEEETNDKVFKLRLDDLVNQKTALEQEARERLDSVEGDVNATPVEKAAARANFYTELINLQKAFNLQADALEKQYSNQSEKSANERHRTLLGLNREFNKALLNSNTESANNEFDELDNQLVDRFNAIRAKVIQQAQEVFSSNANAKTKKKLLDEIEVNARKQMLKAEEDSIQKQIDLNDYLHAVQLISDKQYFKNKQDLNDRWLDNQKKANEVELTEEQKKQAKKNRILEQTNRTLNSFVDAYLANQNKQINANYDEQVSFIAKEKEMRLAQAQSAEEKQAIEAQAAEKEKEAANQRAKERKELAKKQLAIEFALASIKAISTSYDIYEGFIKEALVIGEYAAKLAIIDAQQFGMGGEVPGDGGEFGGRSHGRGGTNFFYRGRKFNAEAKELAIINKNSAQSGQVLSVTGTPKQIASAVNSYGGGVNFAPGASLVRFAYGGLLGSSLMPPAFMSSYYGSRAQGGDTETWTAAFNAIAAVNNRIDTLRVILNPHAVGYANSKYTKETEIGTL